VKKYKVRVIKWLDSCMCHAQVDESDYPTPSVLVSAGFVVKETAEYVTLARDTHLNDGDCRGLICIPRIAILKETKC